MKKIYASQLAILLDISKDDAGKKITVALNKASKNPIEYDKKSDPSADIEIMSKHLGVDLNFYLNDIKVNFLKNSSTGSWIMDYPVKKLKVSKSTGCYPKTVTIPRVIKSLLSEETIKEIIRRWEERYIEYAGVTFK